MSRGDSGLADRPDPSMCTHKFGFDGRVCYLCGWDFRANGEPPAPASLSLAEVLALLAKATPGEWRAQAERAIVILGGNAGGFCIADCPHAGDNATAIVAAVNYLRSHGEAIKQDAHKARLWDSLMEARATTARDPDDTEWKRVARAGRLIEAIKECRTLHGFSLREAKDCVEAYITQNTQCRAALAKVASNGDTK